MKKNIEQLISECEEQGYNDYYQGVSKACNPYDIRLISEYELACAWFKGWKDANEENWNCLRKW